MNNKYSLAVHQITFIDAVKSNFRGKKQEFGIMIIIGALFCVASLFMKKGRGPGDSDLAVLILQLMMALIGLLLTFTPIISSYRLWFAMRFGLRTQAEVIDTNYDASADSSLGAVEHGLAKGKYRIVTPRAFETSFEIDKAWAQKLRKGSVVDVIIDPIKNRVLQTLGMHEGSIEKQVYENYSVGELNKIRIIRACIRCLPVFIALLVIKLFIR